MRTLEFVAICYCPSQLNVCCSEFSKLKEKRKPTYFFPFLWSQLERSTLYYMQSFRLKKKKLVTGKYFIFFNCTTWRCNFTVSPQDGDRVNLELMSNDHTVNGNDGALKNVTAVVVVRCTFNHCPFIQTHCVILYYYIHDLDVLKVYLKSYLKSSW